jgi:hypothetical protein
MEGLGHDENGQLVTGSFVDYAVPTVDRVPPIDVQIVEVPAPDGPFGAKGVGEAPGDRRGGRGGERRGVGHGRARVRPAALARARVVCPPGRSARGCLSGLAATEQ